MLNNNVKFKNIENTDYNENYNLNSSDVYDLILDTAENKMSGNIVVDKNTGYLYKCSFNEFLVGGNDSKINIIRIRLKVFKNLFCIYNIGFVYIYSNSNKFFKTII